VGDWKKEEAKGGARRGQNEKRGKLDLIKENLREIRPNT
jgi:hypothetical protein